jgi:hypothetical protein
MNMLRKNQLEKNALYQLVTRDFNGNVEDESEWVRVHFDGKTFRSVEDGDYWGEWLNDENDDGTLDVVKLRED